MQKLNMICSLQSMKKTAKKKIWSNFTWKKNKSLGLQSSLPTHNITSCRNWKWWYTKNSLDLPLYNWYCNNHKQKQSPRDVPRKRCSENVQQIYRRSSMLKCDFNKVALQLYWNRTSAWVSSCKFAAYFQNTFS